jgi:iron complex transport system permease protein
MSLSQTLQTRKRQRLFLALILLGCLVVLMWLSLISGSNGLNFKDSSKLLNFTAQEQTFQMIIGSIRFPRALAAVMVGALLGLSGAVMQGVLRNPLASPFTLGISQAAGFGAAVAIILLPQFHFTHPLFATFSIAICAFLASMLCTLGILWISSRVSLAPTSIILAGVGLGSLFHSGTMFLQYFTDEMSAAATLFWTFGDLSKASTVALFVSGIVFVPMVVLFWMHHWKFDALGFGDESAFNKGVNVNKFRTIALIGSALCTAVAVAFFGIIGFIGLIAPHMVRMVLGGSHGALLPLSAFFGAVLLLGADLVARMLLYPTVLPVGILTSFIGAPLLLYLLVTLKRVQ